MQAKQFGIKIMLKYGHSMMIVLPEARTVEIVKKWNSRWYQVNKQHTIHGVDDTYPWSVLVDEVTAIQAFEIQAQQQQQGIPEFKPITALGG